jgi:dihydrolipoamide dehydrogenase
MGKESVWEDRFVPRGIYTKPEAASVGITQSEAEQKGIEIIVGRIPYATNSRAMTLWDTAGAVKIIAGARYREILGVHIVGPYATELISEAVLAVNVEAIMEDFVRAIKLHPTLSESLGEAARDSLGEALYVPKR